MGDLTTLEVEITKPLSDEFYAALMKIEAIYTKYGSEDENMKDKYSTTLEEAYKKASNDITVDYLSAMADIKE